MLALKQSPAKMSNGNPFKSSEYWSTGFQNSLGFPAGSENPDKPWWKWRSSWKKSGLQSYSMRGAEDLRHLRGGSGAQLGQDRAGMEQDCNHKE